MLSLTTTRWLCDECMETIGYVNAIGAFRDNVCELSGDAECLNDGIGGIGSTRRMRLGCWRLPRGAGLIVMTMLSGETTRLAAEKQSNQGIMVRWDGLSINRERARMVTNTVEVVVVMVMVMVVWAAAKRMTASETKE